MYHPGLGRWLNMDPIGFSAGDVNLYRSVNNSPVTYTDPSGLSPFISGLISLSFTTQFGVDFTSGDDEPPDYRKIKPPSITLGKVEYSYFGNPDFIQWTKTTANKITFTQQTTTDGVTIREKVIVDGFGWRRFPKGGGINDSGDHVAYILVRAKFIERVKVACGKDEKLDDRWEQYGFSINYGIFLRSVAPAINELVTKKMVQVDDESYQSFIQRFIVAAKAIPPGDPKKK